MTVIAAAAHQSPFGLFGVNWIGVFALYWKEVKRFFKVITQTILAPVITTMLFAVVFRVALSGARAPDGAIPYEYFLAPGLVMMAVLQNAFLNTSSSLMMSKVQGNIVDCLMPPLSAGELTFAFIMGGTTRGLLVAIVSLLSLLILPFPMIVVSHVWAIVFFAIGASMMMSAIGVVAGVWAEKFDQMALVTNFVVTPLTFLSGTFYSVEQLGGVFHAVTHANPFFYLIDGFRYGFIGKAGSDIGLGVAIILILNIGLCYLCYKIFATGYRLKN
jgi:ABC-2 type transport system permease protein